jgi:hypothetical protein
MTSPGSSASTINNGVHIYTGGIGLQEFFIVCFTGLMILFQRRATELEKNGVGYRDRRWRPLLYALYVALAFITIRICYRIAEYANGISTSNAIPYHEAYPYCLDALPMMFCIIVLSVYHPGRYLVGPDSKFPKKTRAEKKAEKQAKKEAKRAKKEQKKAEKLGIKASRNPTFARGEYAPDSYNLSSQEEGIVSYSR